MRKSCRGFVFGFVAAFAVLGGMQHAAEGSVLITAQETGGNVVFTLSGSVDLTGATAAGTVGESAFVRPEIPAVSFHSGSGDESYILTTTQWQLSPFGVGAAGGAASIPSSTIGDIFYISGGGGTNRLILDPSYVSGNPLTGTMTFAGKSFSTMGITPGNYVYDLTFSGTGAVSQNVTLNAVPEPSTVGLLAMAAIACGGGVMRRIRRGRPILPRRDTVVE